MRIKTSQNEIFIYARNKIKQNIKKTKEKAIKIYPILDIINIVVIIVGFNAAGVISLIGISFISNICPLKKYGLGILFLICLIYTIICFAIPSVISYLIVKKLEKYKDFLGMYKSIPDPTGQEDLVNFEREFYPDRLEKKRKAKRCRYAYKSPKYKIIDE